MNVEPLWKQYKDKGLEVWWVLGETKDHTPPTTDQCLSFIKDKGVTFKVLRDTNFLQVYGHIKPAGTSLPNQYILDGNTMELVYELDGLTDAPKALDKIKALLGQ